MMTSSSDKSLKMTTIITSKLAYVPECVTLSPRLLRNVNCAEARRYIVDQVGGVPTDAGAMGVEGDRHEQPHRQRADRMRAAHSAIEPQCLTPKTLRRGARACFSRRDVV